MSLTVLLVAGLAACTTTSAGEPRPTDQGSAPSSDESESNSTSEDPPEERPRDIPLDGMDPCTLIPQADYSDFYINAPGRPSTNTDGQPICAWVDTEVGSFGIVLYLNEGIEVWLDGTKSDEGEHTDPIRDFPTVTSPSSLDDNVCVVAVDVADGQYLLAQVSIDNSDLSRVPPVCDFAYQFAESAMSTLGES